MGQPDFELIKQEWFNPPFEGFNAQGECSHLQWNEGLPVCGIYDHRPGVCRTFPDHPGMIKDIPACTFTF